MHPNASARLVVSTRTYVEKFGGTFGFSIPGIAASTAIGAGGGVAAAIQLDQTTDASGFRSNFGFAEVAGSDAVVRVTARSGDTGAVLGARKTTRSPRTRSMQVNVSDILGGSGGFNNLYLEFSVDSGAGADPGLRRLGRQHLGRRDLHPGAAGALNGRGR